MTNLDSQRRKRLYIILPIATVAVIAAIIIPMIILNRPIDDDVPAPVKFTNDTEAYAFAAISSARLIDTASDNSADELDIAEKYLAALDGFWDNDGYAVTSGRNTDESIPYYTQATINGTDFGGDDYKFTLYYTEKNESSSELRPGGDISASPGDDSPATPQNTKYSFRGALPIGSKTYTLDGERTLGDDDRKLTLTVSNGDIQVKCTRTFEWDLDFDSKFDGSSVTTSSAAVSRLVPIFYYSITVNGIETERATLMMYPINDFSLIIERGNAKYKFTAYRFTESAIITVTDGTKYDIEKQNGKYELKLN